MNKPIRTMSVFCLLLFLALMVNATWLQYVKAGDLNDDSRNRRVIEDAFSRERGAILVGREPVAESKKSDDRYNFQRAYPEPLKYATVTGTFSYFDQSFIERSENSVLSGDDSSLFVDRMVDLVNNTQPQGGNVQLTINRKAQDAAYNGLNALGSDVQGSVVAIEPSTGKVLAMVSLPSYDPNKLASHDLREVDRVSRELNSRKDQPLLNRGTEVTLPPGSTFKLVTAAAALESDKYDGTTRVPGGPSYKLPQSSNVIANGGRDCGSGKITMTQALENSCNTTFLALANELGQDRMRDQAEKFGFNSELLDDFDGDEQTQSVYPRGLDNPQTALTGIGQFDVRATPLQMALVTAGIANEGTVMKPYLVDSIQSPDFDTIKKTDDEVLSNAMESGNARDLADMLVSVVDNGTGTPAAIPGYRVGGKTGTAESGRADGKNYAWFVSFAGPQDGEPEVAVAVMIQNAPVANDQIAGGALAGPIARDVMRAVIEE